MADYTPTTDEVETAFHEFASDLESKSPGEYPNAPEFADWRAAMHGFRRWLDAHDRETAARAWDEGYDDGVRAEARDAAFNPHREGGRPWPMRAF